MLNLRLGICTLSRRDGDGFVGYQADWLGEQSGGGQPLEAMHPYGFRSRPRSPEVAVDGTPLATGAAALLYDAQTGLALPLQDPRDAAALPDEGEGGALMYASSLVGLATLLLSGDTGAATLTLPGAAVCTVGPVGAAPVARAAELQTWAALVTASLNAILAVVAPPGGPGGTPVLSLPNNPPLPPLVALPPISASVAATRLSAS